MEKKKGVKKSSKKVIVPEQTQDEVDRKVSDYVKFLESVGFKNNPKTQKSPSANETTNESKDKRITREKNSSQDSEKSFEPVESKELNSETPIVPVMMEVKPTQGLDNLEVLKEWHRGINSGEFNDGKTYYLMKSSYGDLIIARNSSNVEIQDKNYKVMKIHMSIS